MICKLRKKEATKTSIMHNNHRTILWSIVLLFKFLSSVFIGNHYENLRNHKITRLTDDFGFGNLGVTKVE